MPDALPDADFRPGRRDGGTPKQVTGTIVPGQWVHVTGAFDASASLTLYVIGAAVGQNTASIPGTINSNTAAGRPGPCGLKSPPP